MPDRGSPEGKNLAARAHVSRVSRAIKPAIETKSFIAFLLRERSRVREFGARTHVLAAGLWPPGIALDPNLIAFLAQQVQPWAGELAARLVPLLENGWLYLTPRQYNLVALLKRLCGRLQALDFSKLNLRDRNLVDRLRRIESMFLMLQYNPDSMGVILSALRVHHEKQQQGPEEVDASHALVIRLLTEDCTLPSFFNCLVGFNIFKHRRFLSLADLARPGIGETVDTVGFDCEPRVQARIDEYLSNSLSSLRELHEQLVEARRVNQYIAVDEQERPVAAALWEIYKAGEAREPADFDADQENLVPFLSRLIRGFDRTFSQLLEGACPLSEGKAFIFARSFFELELTRLRTLAGKLENDVFRLTHFPLHRYLHVRKSRLDAAHGEGDVTDLIGESVACLVDIGQTISKVLALRARAGDTGAGAAGAAPAGPAPAGPAAAVPGAAGPVPPLQPIALRGKPFVLPHENERLRAGSPLAGKTVVEALTAAVTVCFTTGMLFQDDFVVMFVGKEKKLEGDLRQRMKQVEHLLDPVQYRETAQQLA
jgi:hypothetical protein